MYGIAVAGANGRIPVPPDAIEEYGFTTDDGLVAMSGSRTSGGFILTSMRLLSGTPFRGVIEAAADLCGVPGASVKVGHRWLAGTKLDEEHTVFLPEDCLARFGIMPGSRLAVARGSRYGLGFLAKGPILDETIRHPGLPVYECV